MADIKNYIPGLMYGLDIGVNVDLADIRDVNGNEAIEIDAVASAVNYIRVTNAATGTSVVFSAQGEDANVDFQLLPLGTGNVLVGGIDAVVEASNVVTINSQRGVITTASLTTGSAATYEIDMTNDRIAAGDTLFACITRAENTAGIPIIAHTTTGAGSALIHVSNVGGDALNGTVEISFMVI